MHIPISFRIESERLILRSASRDDFPHIFSATRYKGFNDGMVWDPPSHISECESPYQASIQNWNNGEEYGFSILQQPSGLFLGKISIRKTDEANVWNIGFWTHPEQQGKGIMSTAVGHILTFGFRNLNAIRIEAEHAIWNKASERVLYKNGFRFVTHIKQGFMKHGQWVEEHQMAINRTHFLSPNDASDILSS